MLSLENRSAFCEFCGGRLHRKENLKTVFLCRRVTSYKVLHIPDTYILIEYGVKISSYAGALYAASAIQTAIFSLYP